MKMMLRGTQIKYMLDKSDLIINIIISIHKAKSHKFIYKKKMLDRDVATA